jgi:alkylation response protein AidB-like acyl-CoA dehydrogenase
MSYDFRRFRQAMGADWFDDDPLLQRLIERYAPGSPVDRIAALGPSAAGPLRDLAEVSARPENAPALGHRDPFGNRVDRVLLPSSTREALAIAHGVHGLGAVRGDPFVHYAMIYLLAQNGEAGVACSLACTDGLERALAALGDGPVHRAALEDVRGSTRDRFTHGAQFVTEIQGGSDVRANRTRAVPDGDRYRLHGEKWFCSNINADWFLVTAQSGPDSGTAVGLYLVPAYRGGDNAGDRNRYRIERLKDKLGTRELATAEVTFDGAEAWAVGTAEAGLAHLLRYVLTPSRFACALFAAAALRQAERIVSAYAGFREAFGQTIARFPLVGRALDGIAGARARALACTFELLRLWQAAESSDDAGEDAVDFRVLLSLAKPALTREGTRGVHEAIMVLGGNGIEERFSLLPRLYRDSVIMETWEGPHNVLYTQALRDLARFRVDAHGFVARAAGPGNERLAHGLAAAMATADRDVGVAALAIADVGPGLVSAVGERVLRDLA